MATLYNRAAVSTATAGSGTITLGAALAAGAAINSCSFQTFATAGASTGDVVSYLILDANGAWEYGTGTYTAAGTTLSRTLGQSSTGSLLVLSGSAQVFITLRKEDVREVLSADRTYYVRTDGSDSNTGLANTAGGAFLTVQKAVNTFATLDGNGFRFIIQIGAGTFSGNIDTSTPLLGNGGFTSELGIFGALFISGVDASGSTVLTSASLATLNIAANVVVLKNLEIQAASVGMYIYGIGTVYFESGVRIGTCGSIQISPLAGGSLFIFAPYAIVGAGFAHLYINGQGFVQHYATPTICTGSLAFTQFIFVNGAGYYEGSAGFDVGGATVTGQRYVIQTGGILNTNGGGPNYFPGNSAGTGGTTAGDGFFA